MIALLLCALSAVPASPQDGPWGELGRESTAVGDEALGGLLLELPLAEAVELARALPDRPVPSPATQIRVLTTAGPGAGGRNELLTRIIIERSLALHGDGGGAAVASAAGALPLLFARFRQTDSTMLRTAVWRLAAAAPAAARERIRAASYAAAAALHRRHAESRARDAGRDPERDAEALAFLAYAAAAADPALTPFIDAIREESRSPAVVRRARALLAR